MIQCSNLSSVCSLRYTLLVGKPPFETSCLKETYSRIKKNNYVIPWVKLLCLCCFVEHIEQV